jgi:hypothetical protein
MGTGDGRVLGSRKILDNGPDASRFNMVLLAEGFQENEQAAFNQACDDFVAALRREPGFELVIDAINVYRVNVASDESGADDPTDCGGTGASVATYFDATYCNAGIRRLTSFNSGLVRDTADEVVPAWHVAGILINSSVRGGSGGNPFSAAMDGDWINVVLHELGHSAFGLADEYEYWQGCGIDTDRDTAPPGEPSEPNVTAARTLESLKWRHLVASGIPVPTVENPDCSQCDTRPNVLPDALQIGLFEGAKYYHCGRYRPAFNCKMRQSHRPFCAVCLEAVAERLRPFLNIGAVLAAEGRIAFLRVHDVGTGWGPPNDSLDVEAVVRLDMRPAQAFGFQLRDDRESSARRRMLDLLRDAFRRDRRVRLDYVRTGLRNGRILRVMQLT